MLPHNFRIWHLTLIIFLWSLVVANVEETPAQKPNIVLILTDDQDEELHGMFPMQNVKRLIGEAGATFTNAFTSSPLCCPSRASILSGMYAHNHRTTNNSQTGGCNGNYWRTKVEPHAIPALLQKSGYDTFFAGKYLNQYHGAQIPPGWKNFYGLHGNSRYYNYTLRENDHNVSYTEAYLTDLLLNKTLDFFSSYKGSKHEQGANARPFFVMIAPPAPHAPFTPAPRHRNAFAHIKALRTPNFNQVAEPLEKHWLLATARTIPEQTLATMDTYFQGRWEALLAVDELVSALLKHLEELGELKNTYIIYTSDNGYHIGQFAQPFDKRQPYEADIRVPLLIRGPGIGAGVRVSAPVMLLDLMPTVLEWAELPELAHLDGLSFNEQIINAENYDALLDKQFHRSLLVQHWGEGNMDTFNSECPWQRNDRLTQCTIDADCHCQDVWNNTYACVRHFRYDIDRLYCEFQDKENFVEAYDLGEDPYQMSNLGYELLPIERAFYSLALANLTRCAGATCNNVNI